MVYGRRAKATACGLVLPGELRVLLSLDDFDDGIGEWLHASASYAARLPTWEDLKEVHQLFLLDLPAIQILPPKAHWLTAHEFTLHLFTRLDADTVPPGLWAMR
jgi:hypothetical protein